MQETPVLKLQPALATKLKAGVSLKQLVAAGVLANARTFGDEDYIGFHTLMALSSALKMSGSMPDQQQALPVFKVLDRNTSRMQGMDPEAVFKTLLRYAVSEDGALHGEKYFQTTRDEFHRTRPAFRWRQLMALVHVTASEFGRQAPGQAEAQQLLGV